MVLDKIKCDCGEIAVWLYAPDYSGGGNPFRCDECVSRGCSCNYYPKDDNWENGDDENWAPALDEKGREYPCCEYLYDKNGFDSEDYY